MEKPFYRNKIEDWKTGEKKGIKFYQELFRLPKDSLKVKFRLARILKILLNLQSHTLTS